MTLRGSQIVNFPTKKSFILLYRTFLVVWLNYFSLGSLNPHQLNLCVYQIKIYLKNFSYGKFSLFKRQWMAPGTIKQLCYYQSVQFFNKTIQNATQANQFHNKYHLINIYGNSVLLNKTLWSSRSTKKPQNFPVNWGYLFLGNESWKQATP